MTLTRRLEVAAAGLRRSPGEVVKAASSQAKKDLLKEARGDTGGDLKFSGLRNGRAVGVKVDVRDFGTDAAAVITPAPKTQALWTWLQDGTRAHAIPRKNRRKKLRINGNWVTGPVRHPGTSGKRTWTRGLKIDEMTAEGARAFSEAVSRG